MICKLWWLKNLVTYPTVKIKMILSDLNDLIFPKVQMIDDVIHYEIVTDTTFTIDHMLLLLII